MITPKNNSIFSKITKITKTTTKPSYLQETNTVTFDDFFKIVIILDESGSMETIRNQIIKSINDLITEQKQIKGRPATLTLVKFSDTVTRVITNKLLDNVATLSHADYKPNGSTALYDAIGKTIEWFRNEKEVLMVIVTDGQENASRQYTKTDINKMIEDKKKNNNWSYVYLSSDITTQMQGDSIGLQKSKHASNCVVDQSNFGDFIGSSLNSAIKGYRTKGISVQSQLK